MRRSARRAAPGGVPCRRGQSLPEVARTRSTRSRMAARSISDALAGPAAGSAGARSCAARSCYGLRRGSRTDNTRYAGRRRNFRHSQGWRRSCTCGSRAHTQSGRGNPLLRSPPARHPRCCESTAAGHLRGDVPGGKRNARARTPAFQRSIRTRRRVLKRLRPEIPALCSRFARWRRWAHMGGRERASTGPAGLSDRSPGTARARPARAASPPPAP